MKSKNGHIVMVEDDVDDQELFREVFQFLKVTNKLLFFSDGLSAFQYLSTTEEKIFLILCDINLPGMNGLELRKEINDNEMLRRKSIPFIMFSTDASPKTVDEAYHLTVQGFFPKGISFQEYQETLKIIIEYWTKCRHPNN